MDFKDDNIIVFSGSGSLAQKIYNLIESKNKYFIGFEKYYDGEIKPYKMVEYTDFDNIINICKNLKSNKIFLLGGINVEDFLEKENCEINWKYKNFFKGENRGDDFILKKIIQLLKTNDIDVLSVDMIENFKGLKKGVFGKYSPSNFALDDIRRGIKVLDNQSNLDIGQSVIVQNQVVLAIEAAEGTDNCIMRTKDYVMKNSPVAPTLIKKIKLNQSRKCDIPTIGINTFKNCYAAGIMGVCVSADGIIFLDKDEVLEFINEKKMFLIGV